MVFGKNKINNQTKFVIAFILVIIIASVALIYFSNEDNEKIVNIGGERDSHGCLIAGGYAFDNEVGACIRAFEMTQDIKRAAKIAVDKVGKSYGLTVISFNSYEEKGSYDIIFEQGLDGKQETVYIKNWQVVSVWQTYDNQIHKFEIKYPSDWLLQKEVGVPPETTISYRWENGSYCQMNLLIVDNKYDNSSEMEWYRQNGYQEENFMIGGANVTRFTKLPIADSRPVSVIYFNNNSDRIDMVASADKYDFCSPIFEQMLGSYKVL